VCPIYPTGCDGGPTCSHTSLLDARIAELQVADASAMPMSWSSSSSSTSLPSVDSKQSTQQLQQQDPVLQQQQQQQQLLVHLTCTAASANITHAHWIGADGGLCRATRPLFIVDTERALSPSIDRQACLKTTESTGTSHEVLASFNQRTSRMYKDRVSRSALNDSSCIIAHQTLLMDSDSPTASTSQQQHNLELKQERSLYVEHRINHHRATVNLDVMRSKNTGVLFLNPAFVTDCTQLLDKADTILSDGAVACKKLLNDQLLDDVILPLYARWGSVLFDRIKFGGSMQSIHCASVHEKHATRETELAMEHSFKLPSNHVTITGGECVSDSESSALHQQEEYHAKLYDELKRSRMIKLIGGNIALTNPDQCEQLWHQSMSQLDHSQWDIIDLSKPQHISEFLPIDLKQRMQYVLQLLMSLQ
jgi:hypothetical protein